MLIDEIAKFARQGTPVLICIRLSERSMRDILALIPDKSGIADNISHVWGVRLEKGSPFLGDEHAQLLFSDKNWKMVRIRPKV